jgi:hypothetical protein
MTIARPTRASHLRAMVILLLAGWLVAGPAWAEVPRDWQRLPDGRVVIDIHGRRVAFRPDRRWCLWIAIGRTGPIEGREPRQTKAKRIDKDSASE